MTHVLQSCEQRIRGVEKTPPMITSEVVELGCYDGWILPDAWSPHSRTCAKCWALGSHLQRDSIPAACAGVANRGPSVGVGMRGALLGRYCMRGCCSSGKNDRLVMAHRRFRSALPLEHALRRVAS